MRYVIPVLVVVGLILSSCYKDDFDPGFDKDPPDIDSNMVDTSLNMGSDYTEEIYYDIDSGRSHYSPLSRWDLAITFDGNKDPYIQINTGTGWTAYTHLTKYPTGRGYISFLLGLPENYWHIDNPSGKISELALGNFTNIKGLVDTPKVLRKLQANGSYKFYDFVFQTIKPSQVKFEIATYNTQKDQFISAYTVNLNPSDAGNQFRVYIRLGDTTYAIRKNIELPGKSWDFKFTRYAKYFPVEKINYVVTGTLFSPAVTYGYKDSVTDYKEIDSAWAVNVIQNSRPLDPFGADLIGFDWKTYNTASEEYFIVPNYNYLFFSSNLNVYKMHFLSFYNNNRQKGCPSFEYKKLY